MVVRVGEVRVGGKEESARSASGVRDGLAWLGADACHHGPDERTGREVLSRPGFRVLGVAFQQTLVDVALDVGVEHHPMRAVDHVDQPEELGRIVDLVLRLGEDLPQHPSLLAEPAEERNVMRFELRTAAAGEAGPVVAFGNADVAVVGRPGVFVGHLEEDQVGQLLEVIAVADAVVTQRGTEAPDFGDDGGGVHSVASLSWRASASPAGVRRYRWFRLVGLSGKVISMRPASSAGFR